MKRFIGLVILLIGFSGSVVLGQEPSPAAIPEASPAKHKRSKKKEEAAATTAPATTTTTSPAAVKSSSVKQTTAPATAPAPGGGPGMVWVNTETHVYHKAGSRWYGKTKKGQYMTEQQAMKEGDRPAKDEAKKTQ